MTVDFGFKKVSPQKKGKLVKEVFDAVASRYDVMNNLMSFGLQHLWKEKLLNELYPLDNKTLLDVAAGTMDISSQFLQSGGLAAIAVDINENMLHYGYKKLADKGIRHQNLQIICADAENLPFEGDIFDYYTISFGIRNVTNKQKALKEAKRVLKPGGKFICLEFSDAKPYTVKKLYDYYLMHIIPKLGKMVTHDENAYRYLAESIKCFPKANIFANMIKSAGFSSVDFYKLTFGVVAIHYGYKV